MEKRQVVQKKLKTKDKKSLSATDHKLAKIKQALEGVNWNHQSLFNDINGFIEGHEKNNQKIKMIESEKQKIHSELIKSDQKISFLGKKLDEKQSELLSIRRKYQERVDTLLKIRNDLLEKFEDINNKKQASESKIDQFREVIKSKEAKLNDYQQQIMRKDKEIEAATQSYEQTMLETKALLLKKSEDKERLAQAKSKRIQAEKEQLQTYISELAANNTKSSNQLAEVNKTNEEISSQNLSLKSDKKELELKFNKDKEVSKKIMSSLNTELNEKTKEINYLNKKIDDLLSYQEKFKSFEQERLSLNQKVILVSKDLSLSKSEYKKLMVESETNLKKINEYKAEIEYLNRENKSWTERFDNLVLEHEQQSEKILLQKSELQESFDLVATDLKKAEELIGKKSNELQVQRQKIDRFEASIKASDTDLENKSLDLKTALEDNKNLREQIVMVGHQMSVLRKTFESKTDEMVELERQLKDFSELKVKFKNLDKDLSYEKEQNRSVLEKLSVALNKIDFLEQDYGVSIKQSESLAANNKKLELSLKDQKIEFETEISKLEKDKKIEIDKISEILVQAHQKIADNLRDLELLEIKINGLETQEVLLKKKNEDLTAELSLYQDEVLKSDDFRAESEDKISAVNVQLNELQLEIIENKKSMSVSEQRQKSLNSTILDAHQKIEELKIQLSSKETVLISKQKIIDDSIRDHKSSVTLNDGLKEEVLGLNQKLEYKNSMLEKQQILFDQLEFEKKDLIAEATGLQDKIHDLKEKNISLQKDLSSQALEKESLLEEKRLLGLSYEDKKAEADSKQGLINKSSEEHGVLIGINKNLENRITDLESQIANKSRTLEIQNAHLYKLELCEKEFDDKIVDLNIEISGLIEENSFLQADISLLMNDKKEQLLELNGLQATLDNKNTEILSLKEVLDVKSDESDELLKKNQSLSDEIIDLNINLKQKDFDFNLQYATLTKLKDEAEIKEKDYKELERRTTIDLSEKTKKIEIQKHENAKLAGIIKDLEFRSVDLGSKIVDAGTKYESVFNQKQSLQNEIDENKDLYAKIKKKNHELDAALHSIKKREEQLSLYSRWVDSQKGSLQKQIIQISSELRATKEFNPLNPYLKITEREISKIEVLMTKSNVFGPQRALLENQYEQLVKQRDEVKELLVKTNQEVDKKAQSLILSLKSSEFIPVPPLPPGKVEPSETEIPSS